MESTSMEQVDRISQLPEPILQQILSFLDIKQIVQASSVSKTWQQAWNTFPILDFDSEFFKESWSRFGKNPKAIDFVERTLSARCRQKIILEKLKLELNFCCERFKSALTRWVGYAIDSNVQDLTISVCRNCNIGNRHKLPPNVLSARSVMVLNLGGCKFELPHGNFALLSNLKSISLRHIHADDNSMRCLVNGCPLIEEMSLTFCVGFKALHLHGLTTNKLKHIILDSNFPLQTVKIEALNFDFLWIDGPVSHLDIDMAACRNLDRFRLFNIKTSGMFIHVMLSKFRGGKYYKVCNHRESLISGATDFIEVDMDGPCFHTFCFSEGVISFSPENMLTLSTVKLHWTMSHIDNHLSTKLVDAFMSSFSHCDLFSQTNHKNNIVPRELGDTTFSPLCSIEELNFSTSDPLESCQILQVVESLLWICPHVEKLCITSRKLSLTFQFSYGRSTNGGEISPCSNSTPVACWQYCVKSVKVNKKGSRVPKLASESYYFEEDIWENIKSLVRNSIRKRREIEERDENLQQRITKELDEKMIEGLDEYWEIMRIISANNEIKKIRRANNKYF